jgi:hypothetical protein
MAPSPFPPIWHAETCYYFWSTQKPERRRNRAQLWRRPRVRPFHRRGISFYGHQDQTMTGLVQLRGRGIRFACRQWTHGARITIFPGVRRPECKGRDSHPGHRETQDYRQGTRLGGRTGPMGNGDDDGLILFRRGRRCRP